MNNSGAATPPLATQQSHLRQLSESLSAFQQCFSDLQLHINSIRTSIDSLLPPPHTSNSTPLLATSSQPAAPAPEPEPEPSWESDPSEDIEEEEVEGEEKDVQKEEYNEKVKEEEVNSPHSELKPSRSELITPGSELKSPGSELEILCQTMDSEGLREYMITHIQYTHELRVQVPKALKLSPGPASLVFKCMGKFYNKGSKSYVNNSPLIQERKTKVHHRKRAKRKALVLLLECFLLMMGTDDDNKGFEIEKEVKEEAEQAALAWLKRMNLEGGVKQAQEMDARGLLMFIGCFGIPDKFNDACIRDLLQVSNINWISDAIRRSNVLMAKIPEIIGDMVANKTVVKAVHIAYCFGIQDRFNPKKLLASFLRESKSSFDKMNGSQGAHPGNIGAKRKYLNDLKSVIKCLRCHNIDPAKLLGGWQINMRIMSLEKEIAEFNKQIADHKMAQPNAGLRKRKVYETEWLSNQEVKRSHFSNPWPPHQQQRVVVNHVVSNNTLLEGGGTAGHNYGYSMSPPVLHGPVAGSIHENVVGSLAGALVGAAMVGPGAGILPSPQGGAYAGGHGGSRVDSTPRQVGSHAGQLHGSCGNAYRPVPYMESSKGLPNTVPGDANRRSPPQLEVSTGLPNTIPPLYQFAGTVPATEQNQSSGSQAVDAHPSSPLYRSFALARHNFFL
ncbi:protein FRIGIDA-like [Lycium barbarum]|uniref:protein FRIGIDA-like n=1 Tax=Lycium barbarum TaxID=112863 RepID=UPI00293F25C6|nr:protein FRIGIDA-like [Lycium barbarum]